MPNGKRFNGLSGFKSNPNGFKSKDADAAPRTETPKATRPQPQGPDAGPTEGRWAAGPLGRQAVTPLAGGAGLSSTTCSRS